MEIVSKIVDNIPNHLNELEKARYLYLELCKRLSFSTQFKNTDYNEFAKLYTRKVDINTFNEKQVNCRMWSQLYSQLLNLVGIENRICDMGHQHVEFKYKGERWVADATYGTYTDLSRVKNDDETVGFGLSIYQNTDKFSNSIVLDENVRRILNDVDIKLGYNTNDKQNLLEFKECLMKIENGKISANELIPNCEITDDNIVSLKLEYLFSTIGKLKDGYYEQKDFVRHLINLMLTDKEREDVGAVELKRTNYDKSVDIVQCIYAKCGDKMNYYILSPNMIVNKYEPNQIISLAMIGYGLDKKEIPGIIYPKNFSVGKVSTSLKYRLGKFFNINYIQMPLIDNLEISNGVNK